MEIKTQKQFLQLHKRKFLSKKNYERINPVVSQQANMYGLPKVHKTTIPLRPILSMCRSVQYQLVKWLVEIFNPILQFYSGCCVPDSF